MRLIADCMLGKLAKWLRMLGYDTKYIPDVDDDELTRVAVKEDRILLTRDLKLSERRMLRTRCVFVDWGSTREQVKQVVQALGLTIDRDALFTRCAVCNHELTRLDKDEVRGRVPPYVYSTQQDYGYCPQCDKIYWKGTHVQHVVQDVLQALFEEQDNAGSNTQ